jgi:pyridoxamine 5'-phosphate oxidase family protein
VIFTDGELAYLAAQRLGRMATVQPDGTVQVNPVSRPGPG